MMIASVEGIITEILDDSLVINVGGLGFRVFVPTQIIMSAELHKRIAVFTHLVVREESLTLYGFESIEDRDLFNLVLTVRGVGPKTALSIISHVSTDTFKKAVVNNSPDLLSVIPGVGKKTAQSIVLNLQGKIRGERTFIGTGNVALDNDVISALTSLGYSIVEAQTAIQMIPKDTPEDLETRVKIALKYFS